jgi:hypothetical protein
VSLLSLLLSLALQDDIIGWRCAAERTVTDHVYRLEQSVEEDQRSPREFRVNWLAGPFDIARWVSWLEVEGMPPGPPRSILLRVRLSRPVVRPVLRLVTPDGPERVYRDNTWRMTMMVSSPPNELTVLSLDPDLNRWMWSARGFRVVVEDRRGHAVGALEVRLPAPDEAVRVAAELDPEVEAKLRDPANPANNCSPYGSEAYIDPA